MRILVTGASGFIGRHLVAHLRERGDDVCALSRGVDGAPSDLRQVGEWAGWPESLDAVVHLAALNPARSDPAARDDAALMEVNVSATKAVAEAAVRRGVRRFVYASTNLVHPLTSEPFDENAPEQPQNAYASSKLAGEAAAWGALEGGATQGVVLRLPPVYGPGGRGGVAALLRISSLPVPLPLAAPSASRSLLSIANAVDALRQAAAAPEAAGGTFLVCDGEPWSLGEMVAFARQEMGRSPRLFSLPTHTLARIAALAGRRKQYEHVFGSLVVDDSAFRAAADWQPPETTEDGLRRMLRDLRLKRGGRRR
ncbi:NAD-dependent epimerase/dehydratase family protein [Aureimonas flava]|uniref:NAD-dependent epimerase/dehydratase family protein n=1 Tax=Aureimonas flava TaxID=2320271 RepID=UPI00145A00EB|nr:NAD-dependent epimerase/dehydratase family protein [Aureimonas flava]